MSAPNIQTSLALPSGGGDPCNQLVDPCVMFSPASDSNNSHVFTVTPESGPAQFVVFGMGAGESITVQHVEGVAGNEIYTDMVLAGVPFSVEHPNTVLVIPVAGRFRLVFNGELGELTVLCQATDCCLASIFPR